MTTATEAVTLDFFDPKNDRDIPFHEQLLGEVPSWALSIVEEVCSPTGFRAGTSYNRETLFRCIELRSPLRVVSRTGKIYVMVLTEHDEDIFHGHIIELSNGSEQFQLTEAQHVPIRVYFDALDHMHLKYNAGRVGSN